MMKCAYSIVLFSFIALIFSIDSAIAVAELTKAEQLLKAGEFEHALQEVEAVLALQPNNIQARFLKGLLLTRSNQVEEAKQVFIRLTQDSPHLPEPYNNLAVIYAAQGQFEKARQALAEAINTHPSYAVAHENLGDIYAKMASKAYNHALELDVENFNVREKLLLINELFSAEQLVSTDVADKSPAEERIETAEVESEKKTKIKQSEHQKSEFEIAQEATQTEQNELLTRIKQWAKDWSSQDIHAYLSHYSAQFSPSREHSLEKWKAQRRQRLIAPKFIRVSYQNLNINMLNENLAQLSFTQTYQSDTYGDRVKKVLTLRREPSGWLIVEEKNL